jgi:hypothetical protein
MKPYEKKFFVYDSYFSPQQQPDDEVNAPPSLVEQSGLYSDGNSIPRELRKERGYGKLIFKKDLSKCYVYISIKNLKSSNINKIHIHAGAPGILGPIIVNIGNLTNIKNDLASGYVLLTVTNNDITPFTLGEGGSCICTTSDCSCDKENSIFPQPISVGGIPLTTGNIATLDNLSRLGLLYFNFHNNSENFYGIMRGQIYPTENSEECNY